MCWVDPDLVTVSVQSWCFTLWHTTVLFSITLLLTCPGHVAWISLSLFFNKALSLLTHFSCFLAWQVVWRYYRNLLSRHLMIFFFKEGLAHVSGEKLLETQLCMPGIFLPCWCVLRAEARAQVYLQILSLWRLLSSSVFYRTNYSLHFPYLKLLSSKIGKHDSY